MDGRMNKSFMSLLFTFIPFYLCNFICKYGKRYIIQ